MITKRNLNESIKFPASYDRLDTDWYGGEDIDYDDSNNHNYNLHRDFKTSDSRFKVEVFIIPSGANDGKAGGVLFFSDSRGDKAIEVDSYKSFSNPVDAAKYMNKIAEEFADLTYEDILELAAEQVMKNLGISPNNFGIYNN